MSCEREPGSTLARHRGCCLEGPAPARRLPGRRLLLANERLRSTGDAADNAGASNGALQLIARISREAVLPMGSGGVRVEGGGAPANPRRAPGPHDARRRTE
jgi:hypothetical protein